MRVVIEDKTASCPALSFTATQAALNQLKSDPSSFGGCKATGQSDVTCAMSPRGQPDKSFPVTVCEWAGPLEAASSDYAVANAGTAPRYQGADRFLIIGDTGCRCRSLLSRVRNCSLS